MTTPNMGLTLPTVSVTVGPTYATEVNNDFTLVDGHDHSSGKGVAITPSGINISSDLTFSQNNATNLRTARLYNNLSFSQGVNDKTALYALNGELHYIDASGNDVQITLGGVIDVSASISTLNIADNKFSLYYYGDASVIYSFSGANLPTSTTTVFSMPNVGNDTVLTNTSTSVCTNKTFKTTTTALADSTDTTKQIKFSASDNTTGKTLTITSAVTNNRTITHPDATTTLAGLSVAQTFSAAQTLTANINMNAANAIRFYNSGSTFYTSLVAGANSGNYAAVLPLTDGTANQVLTTDGSNNWGWSTPASNTGTVAANDSNVVFTNASGRNQICTPTTTRTYTMATTSIVAGDTWEFENTSTTQYCIIQSSGSNTICNLPPLGKVVLKSLVSTPTTAANWFIADRSSEWVSYTPTIAGMGTCSSVTCSVRSTRNSFLLKIGFVSGTVTGTAVSITFPPWAVFNTAPSASSCTYIAGTTQTSTSIFYWLLNSGSTTALLASIGSATSSNLSGVVGTSFSGNSVTWASNIIEVPLV